MTEKPVWRLDESLFSPADSIPEAVGSLRWRAEFYQKIRAQESVMFQRAVESFEAAISLLTSNDISQAYQLIFQAAEVSLKGFMDNIQRVGSAKWFQSNKKLIRRRAQSNRGFDHETFREAVRDKPFVNAFQEVSAFVDFPPAVQNNYSVINRTRNEIVHRGQSECKDSNYLRQIFTTILPLLDHFYSEALELDLADLIFHEVARELIVAGRVLRECNYDTETNMYAFETVRLAQQYTRGFDDLADAYATGKWEEDLKYALGVESLLKEDTHCKLCRHRCYIWLNDQLYEENGKRWFEPDRITCPFCGIHFGSDEDEQLMIRHHYGRIDRDLLGKNAWVRLLSSRGYIKESQQEAEL